MLKHLVIAAAVTLSLVACDDHDDHAHAEEGLDAHACEHITAGPFAQVSAALDPADAVEAFEQHHLVTVALVDRPEGRKGGMVVVTAPEAGDYRLLLNADVAVAATAVADGAAVGVGYDGPADGCDDALRVVQLESLSQGAAYLLAFGPTDAATVGFVMEHFDGDHEGHEH
ncbi:MAG: hypothetical protein H6702_19990 [Myxococcales bacterium]|nr:hypothetical protein [Myxococcales bacterium]